MPRIEKELGLIWLPLGGVLLALLLALGAAHAEGMSMDLKEQLGVPAELEPQFVLIATSPDKNYTEEQIQQNGPDILSLEAAHIGGQRVLFRVTFAHPVQFIGGPLLHFYLDLDNNLETGRQDNPSHQGVDIMVTLSEGSVSVRPHNPAYGAGNAFAGGLVVDNVLYTVLEAPLSGDDEWVRFRVHLLAERWVAGRTVGASDSTPRQVAELRRQSPGELPRLDRGLLSSLTPLSAYRYRDAFVKYETLENKGLPYSAVAPPEPFDFGRERPIVPFASEVRHPGKAGTASRRTVPVHLLEEAGVARAEAPVTFGLPLPQGAVYDLAHFRLLSPAGDEAPAQFTATAFWPDGSLKWVLVDFVAQLGAREERVYSVEFGHEVRRSASEQAAALRVEESGDAIVVTTGPLRARINKNAFNLFESVWLDTDGDGEFSSDERVAAPGPEGVVLVDEHGVVYTTSARPPESVRVEEAGSQKVVIRVEGQYAAPGGDTYMRYITRLTFRAGSARVHVAHTHVNDYLKTEFTDITSLYVPFVTPAPITRAEVFTAQPPAPGFTVHSGSKVRLFQTDERSATVTAGDAGETVLRRSFWMPGAFPGVIRAETAKGAIAAVIHDFQERWPKGLAAEGSTLRLELLPEQPGESFGANLPYYLMYPFVSGKYRFKWGNAFTERFTVDFSGEASPEELAAEGRLPVVAVIPAAWYGETKAFGPIAAASDALPDSELLRAWDRFVADSYLSHLGRKMSQREFGYLNYGDWFGERGRNWGNNEYDLAHGFFMEFVRTGDRRYYRLALAAARHQADVDIIHAYPNAAFIGGNAPHSVGHTGAWSETLPQATWSKAYDAMYTASNGHTWADGMVDAWLLAGEARVMEAALALGEHIVWSMAPNFRALGTHERSAGWSLKAILALYRATYDPLYLEAARKIATVALESQDLAGSGAWPHALPTDHAGNEPGAVGNNLFLIGVLLGGLQAYHQATGDPAVMTSLEAAVAWVMRSWDPERRGWPYSATVEGRPLYTPSTSLNTLVIPAIAYVGAQRGDARLLEAAAAALDGYIRSGAKSDGKSIAQALHFTAETLAWLTEGRAKPERSHP